jgi:hypothetical protein
MPALRRTFSLSTRRLLIATLFALIFALAVRAPTDTDTWWHLRSGTAILADRAPLLTDPFSFTRGGTAWVNHSWGGQIALTLAYQTLGEAGIALLTAALATLGMAFTYAACTGNPYLRAFILIIASAAAAVFWAARPQMFSFALSAAVLYLLYLYKWRQVDRLWVLIPLMAVWANLHAGFFIAFILIFGFVAGEVIGRVVERENPQGLTWGQIGRVVLIAALSYAALIVNPNGATMWGYSFRTFGIGALQDFIQEWATPNFHRPEVWPFALLLLGSFVALGLSQRRAEWSELALLCGTAFMGLYAGRNISVFAVTAAPILTRHLDAYLTDRGWVLPKARPPKAAQSALNWALLSLILIGVVFRCLIALNPATVAKAKAESLPVAAAAFLNEHRPAGPMFNSYNWGGYLMFAAPDYPVFIDGRTDLYDDALLREWYAAYNGIRWQETFATWGIRLVVVEADSPIARILATESGWRAAYSDALASIYVRTDP